MKLQPLALPKGVKLLCELCCQTAYLQCKFCKVTYYCCKEHQMLDWQAIHEKICNSLEMLRKPQSPILFKDERLRREAEVRTKNTYLMEFSQQTAQKHLYDGQGKLAVPAAQKCLSFAIMVYGRHSLQLIPSYILLAEAYIGLGKLLQAKEYLAQASWKVLRTPDASPAIRSQLHRSLGHLHIACGQNEDALREFAEDIYEASVEYGTDHIHTSGGYFYMADVFFRKGKRLVADSLFRQVTQIWYSCLHRIFKYRSRPRPVRRGVGPGIVDEHVTVVPDVDETQKLEALKVLTTIYNLRKKQRSCPPQEMLMVCLTLGILHFLLNNLDQARELGAKAVALGRHNPDHPLSHDAIHFLTISETVK